MIHTERVSLAKKTNNELLLIQFLSQSLSYDPFEKRDRYPVFENERNHLILSSIIYFFRFVHDLYVLLLPLITPSIILAGFSLWSK